MRKEFILKPSHQGDSQIFLIPKKHLILDYGKRYRLIIEEVD